MANYIRKKRHESKFTTLPNSIFRAKMSLQATGLLCYLLHLPGDWKIRKTELFNNFKNGRDATIKAFNELILSGYIEEEPQRTKTGKFSGNDYFVYDEPYFKAPITENQETVQKQPYFGKPITEKPLTEKPFTENQALINNIGNNNDNTKLTDITSVISGDASENEVKKQKTLHQRVIDAYYLFYQEKNGLPPKIDGAAGNAAKAIITYFKTVARAKDQTLADNTEWLDDEVVKMLEYVFINWSLVRPFLAGQYNLTQINSNLNNIISDIKAANKDTRKQVNTANAFTYFKNVYNDNKRP